MRIYAVFIKESLQLWRDRVTIMMLVMMPLNLLILFGYAIDTNPRHQPMALFVQDDSPLTRTLVSALINSKFFDVRYAARTDKELDALVASGKVMFALNIPADFGKDVLRGAHPSLLVIADASDPTATAGAEAALTGLPKVALAADVFGMVRQSPAFAADSAGGGQDAFSIVFHRRFNPTSNTQMNIVPGLIGIILTMITLMFTSISVTKETELGTMENLLSMPIRPLEIMLGKIAPYFFLGGVELAIFLVFGRILFNVPINGSLSLLLALTLLFVTANLALGYTFSTISRLMIQAMQMTFFYFVPNILLSGFLFPFYGMPRWAQIIGEMIPLTHYLRIVRGIMLKGTSFWDLQYDVFALAAFTLVVMGIAVARFRQTLD
jgi:ABC-2 type transport system permease protein